jgi:hypothetical protein
VAALVVTSGAVALGGCGGSDPAPAAGPGPGGTATAAGTPSGTDRSADWPGAGDDRDVVARRTVAVRRALGARTSTRPTADLVIRGLTVRGKVATLRFSAVLRGWDYDDQEGVPQQAPRLWDINPGKDTDDVAAQLIDPVNLRRHLPLRDSEGEALADMTSSGQSGDGQAMEASWMFAAPPPGVDAMDVQVGSWPVFREVPVVRR